MSKSPWVKIAPLSEATGDERELLARMVAREVAFFSTRQWGG